MRKKKIKRVNKLWKKVIKNKNKKNKNKKE